MESVRTNLSLASGTPPFLAARAGVLSALCLAQMGKLNDARVELESVRETIDNKFNSPPISQSSDLESWHEWWVNHILLQEVQALLQKPSDGSGAR